MSYETFRFPPPLPSPVFDWIGGLASRIAGPQPSTGFDGALLAADPAEVEFALDPASVRTRDEDTQQWNTTYPVSGEMQVSAPGVDAQAVPVRYDVTLRNEDATPERMRAVNPFDPATIPDRSRIEVYGRDYAGTPLEASFRALAEANDLASIEDLRLSLEMTADGGLRVMTASNRLIDSPRDGGPASSPAEREDFVRHTTILEDPRGVDRAGYTRMLLDGTVPADTVRIEEDVADRDALIRGIGELLLRDIATAGHDLDGYALIAAYGADGTRRINGFGYRDGEAPVAATPKTEIDTIAARLDELREATRVDGKPPWTVCVVQLRRAGGKLHAEFVYAGEAQRWAITPATLDEVAERARPDRGGARMRRSLLP